MHPEAEEFVKKAVAAHGPFNTVVDVGGRDVNGTVRPYFPRTWYFSVDPAGGDGVDVVADASEEWDWAPTGGPPSMGRQCVVCCEVFEHASTWMTIVRRAAEWLVPGGTLIVTCATDPRLPHSAVDGELILEGTEYYANVAEPVLREVLSANFSVYETGTHPRGDLYAVAIK